MIAFYKSEHGKIYNRITRAIGGLGQFMGKDRNTVVILKRAKEHLEEARVAVRLLWEQERKGGPNGAK